MASKLNFRARTLDAAKPLSIYYLEDLPELTDLNAISRSVPAMPSGMEKEEEAEKHLQEILESQENAVAVTLINTVQASRSSGPRKVSTTSTSSAAPASPASTSSGALRAPSDLVIPTPEVYVASDFEGIYNTMYKGAYKPPRQYIHVQPFAMDEEMPEYDLDEDDIEFVETKLNDEKKFQVAFGTVEDMLDRLEKNSDNSVISAKEAKLLLKEDDDLILAVYDYWVDKRLKLKQPLVPKVKRDNRIVGNSSSEAANAASTNPYVAFRRRTEKMQTRKNRKNDEVSYEKMLKLRRDLNRAVTLLEMVKRREKAKAEKLDLTRSVFERRYREGDWEGRIVNEALQKRQQQLRAFQNLAWVNQLGSGAVLTPAQLAAAVKGDRQKRPYTKKKKKTLTAKRNTLVDSNGPEFGTNFISSDDESNGVGNDIADDAAKDSAELFNPSAPIYFRRKRNCQYLAPAVDEFGFADPVGWPWDDPVEGGSGEAKFRHSLASLSTPKSRCIGLVRRRVGRGGRIVLDRSGVPGASDQLWRSLDFTVFNGRGVGRSENRDIVDDETPALCDMPHFRPVTPPHCQEDDWGGDKYKSMASALPSLSGSNSGIIIGLPLHPLSKQSAAVAAMQQQQQQQQQIMSNGLGLKKKSVDAVAAHNTATAVVTRKEMEIFAAAAAAKSAAGGGGF